MIRALDGGGPDVAGMPPGGDITFWPPPGPATPLLPEGPAAIFRRLIFRPMTFSRCPTSMPGFITRPFTAGFVPIGAVLRRIGRALDGGTMRLATCGSRNERSSTRQKVAGSGAAPVGAPAPRPAGGSGAQPM